MKFQDFNNNSPIISIGHIDIDPNDSATMTVPFDLPIIPTRNLVLFPEVSIPIKLVRENSLHVAQFAKKTGLTVGIVCQLNPEEENPTLSDLYHYGVFARVIQVIQLPDESQTAIVKAAGKFKIVGKGAGISCPEAEISASVKEVHEMEPKASDKEFVALCEQITSTAQTLAQRASNVPQEFDLFCNLAHNQTPPAEAINMIATHAPLEMALKMKMLAMFRLKERAQALYQELVRQEEMMSIAESVHQRARESFDDQQRRMFLQRQLEAIDQELNGDSGEAAQLRERAAALKLNEKVAEHIEKEIVKLERLNPQSPDYSVQYTYLDTVLALPWNTIDTGSNNFDKATEILDSQHYGLKKIKERILEQIALIMHNPDGKSPIICLVGPPGVGKTSLGKSVAEALGLRYERVSLGGLHDEAEIRGHRRTYIGAMPGRIIEAVRRSGSRNPVLLLDEIDKIGADYKGDPASALLEVLDPEQNCKFHDNYIDIDFDLSKVLFIATANTLSTVSQPLLDRMEIIDLSGYMLEEKIEIAKRHLLPRLLSEMKLETEDLILTDDAITAIIEGYTGESGVRQLEKALASIARKQIVAKLQGKKTSMPIDAVSIKEYLGVPRYNPEKYENNDFPGVVTGLAWTAAGGEILFIETSLSAGKGEKLTLTGNLGDVMKESAMIALQYIRANADKLDIDPERFEKTVIHIHVPEGAIPKDGPSAGITMATSIASAFTGRKVREKTAMTGELTLRGKVLPVGGIKEKILAAKRAGITDIILSEENRKDIDEIEEQYRNGLTFHFVATVAEVLDFALI